MKQVPCYICKELVEIKDERAISKLCSKCIVDPANVEKFKKATQKELLTILNNSDKILDVPKENTDIKSNAAIVKQTNDDTDKVNNVDDVDKNDNPPSEAEKLW